ncbi:hypothetical protein HK096_003953, partial [Nowakowskiella sp. JEL0078]
MLGFFVGNGNKDRQKPQASPFSKSKSTKQQTPNFILPAPVNPNYVSPPPSPSPATYSFLSPWISKPQLPQGTHPSDSNTSQNSPTSSYSASPTPNSPPALHSSVNIGLSPVTYKPSNYQYKPSNILFLKSTLRRYPSNTDISNSPPHRPDQSRSTNRNSNAIPPPADSLMNQRHIIVPPEFTLLQLHVILQTVHGLPDCLSHPHRFYRPPNTLNTPNRSVIPTLSRIKENQSQISKVKSREVLFESKRYKSSLDLSYSRSDLEARTLMGMPSRRCRPGDVVFNPWNDKTQKSKDNYFPFYQIVEPENDVYLTTYAAGCYIAHSHPHDPPVTPSWDDPKDQFQVLFCSNLYLKHVRDERVFKCEEMLTHRDNILIYEYDDIELDVRFEATIELKDVIQYRDDYGQLPQCMAGGGSDAIFHKNIDNTISCTPIERSNIERINSALFKIHDHAILNHQNGSQNSLSRIRSRQSSLASSLKSTYSSDEEDRPREKRERVGSEHLLQDLKPSDKRLLTSFASHESLSSEFTHLSFPRSLNYGIVNNNMMRFSSMGIEPGPAQSSSYSPTHRTPNGESTSISPMKCYMCRRYHTQCKNDKGLPCMSVVRGTKQKPQHLLNTQIGSASAYTPTVESCCEYCLFADRGLGRAPLLANYMGASRLKHSQSLTASTSNLVALGRMSLNRPRSQMRLRDDISEDSVKSSKHSDYAEKFSMINTAVEVSSSYSTAIAAELSTIAETREASMETLFQSKRKILEDERKRFLLTGVCETNHTISGIASCTNCSRVKKRTWFKGGANRYNGNNEDINSDDDEENYKENMQDFQKDENTPTTQNNGGLFAVLTGRWTPESPGLANNSENPLIKIESEVEALKTAESELKERNESKEFEHHVGFKRVSWFWEMDENVF